MKDKLKDKLGKLIAMAKHGTPGEVENSTKIIKKLCYKHDLNFDDVMTETELKEYEFEYKNKKYEGLARRCFIRYGVLSDKSNESEYWTFQIGERVGYKTTLEKHIETMHAFELLKRQFDEEFERTKKAFKLAFWDKHELWNYIDTTVKTDWKPPKKTKEDLKTDKIREQLERNLEDVEIQKRLN